MKIPIDTKAVSNYLLVYLLLFTSGSLIFNHSNQDLLLISSISVAAFAWWIYSTREINIQFLVYLSVYLVFLLVISAYTHGGIPISAAIGQIIKFAFVYFVIATVKERFLEIYVKLIVFLAGVSIIGYISDQFSLFDGLLDLLPSRQFMEPGGLETAYEGLLYMFRYDEHLARNNSIFFEPGAYQFFLNSAMYILLFYDAGFKSKQKLIGLAILLVTILTTQSTTGYIIASIILSGAFLYSKAISNNIKLTTVLMGVLVLVLLSPVLESVVIGKIERYSSIESIRDKKDLRSFDLLVDTEIVKKYPLGLGYEGYSQAFSIIGKKDIGYSSSNGITKLPGIFGLPFAIFYLGSILWAFLIYNRNIVIASVGFIGIIVFLYSEAYYLFTPIILGIIVGMFLIQRTVNIASELK